MGAAVGAALAGAGQEVGWISEGRSPETAKRAEAAGLRDAGSLEDLLDRCRTVISVCPPHAAAETAAEVARLGFAGVYIDANAIAPRTASEIAGAVMAGGASYVDGGLVGSPPPVGEGPRLYLSGAGRKAVAELFEGTAIHARPLDGDLTSASALKACFAAWTKGSDALLLGTAEAARRAGVEAELAAEWTAMEWVSERLARARDEARDKGWRWAGEMREISLAFADLGLPPGFHEAAEKVFEDNLYTYAGSAGGGNPDRCPEG
jgi:3-hydroxyisobutyrate dehydrogenase-like beta-hydroxyacid dehydrogenase